MKSKSYKLKQWYPSLPSTIEKGVVLDYYEVIDGYSDNPSGLESTLELDREEVEDNPEFWEEVITPVYEILSIMNPQRSIDPIITEKGEIKAYLELLGMNRERPWVIYSVKRNSDDKVFQLGDRVFFHENTFNQWIIDNFYIKDDGILIARSKDNQMVEYINTICKVEPTTFTSYDNLELNEKSEYYVVNEKFNFIQSGAPQQFPSFTKNKSKYFVFANKENATNFIIENKPCLSAIDVVNAIGLDLGEAIILKNLIKSRL